MRRHMMRFMLCAMLLMGCTSAKVSNDAKMETYETYYNSISANTTSSKSSEYYAVSYEMVQLADGSYRYYVFFDEPKIAMYDIVILGVEDDISFDDVEKMMPSIGIFDSHYAMVPYQVNSAQGYVKGMAISGESKVPFLQLKTIVEWKDKSGKNITREFLQLIISMDGNETTETVEDVEDLGESGEGQDVHEEPGNE